MTGITSFQRLRQQRHAQWLAVPSPEGTTWPDQIVLFGSRARGDWDGLSDTDLLVVAGDQSTAEQWADQLMDHGIAQDAICLDQEAWQQLPQNPSVIWRNVARHALPLLEQHP